MSNPHGWVGHKLRHDDGRTGEIVKEHAGFSYRELTIRVDGAPGTPNEAILLSAIGPDSGPVGWKWNYDGSGAGAKWMYLGDHNAQRLASVA